MRQPISEYRAKSIVNKQLGRPYPGIQVTDHKKLPKLDPKGKYVIKVDQGIKKRKQQGLITLNANPAEIKKSLHKFQKLGYTQFLVEPFLTYQPSEEKYLSLQRKRQGVEILYSNSGGVDIEAKQQHLKNIIVNVNSTSKLKPLIKELIITSNWIQKIFETFNLAQFSFMEINPLVINSDIHILDLAVEVDSAGEYFANQQWTQNDFVYGKQNQKTPEEINIAKLASHSQASLKFDLINPQGSIWMLLSGGGASIVLADEVHNLGYSQILANYGEYSGNPNDEETYIYTKNLLSLLLKSASSPKILIIAGGVANFTDIRSTFNGIIKALDEFKTKLKSQNVKIYVRRGGPYQSQGLTNIAEFLNQTQLYGQVSGPELPLTEIVKLATQPLK